MRYNSGFCFVLVYSPVRDMVISQSLLSGEELAQVCVIRAIVVVERADEVLNERFRERGCRWMRYSPKIGHNLSRVSH